MDIAWDLFNHHRTQPSRCGRRWNIKHHCGSLRLDRRHFVHNQSLTIKPFWSTAFIRCCAPEVPCLFYMLFLQLDREVEFGLSNAGIVQRKVSLLVFFILLLTALWLLVFFGQSFFSVTPHTGGFIYMLSVLIVFLIMMKFISWI